MCENKALQTIQSELVNNPSKLTEINEHIKKCSKKLREIDPTYSDGNRQLYKDKLGDLNTEKQARFVILSQNGKDLQTQVARFTLIIEKFINKDTSLAERLCIVFREEAIKIISMHTALTMTYVNNCNCYYRRL